jgi:hypothetical protein
MCREVALFSQHVAYVPLGAMDSARNRSRTFTIPLKTSDLNTSVLALRRNIDRTATKTLAEDPHGIVTKYGRERPSLVWKKWDADSFASEIVDELIRRFLAQFRRDHVERQLQRIHLPFPIFWPKQLTAFGANGCLS